MSFISYIFNLTISPNITSGLKFFCVSLFWSCLVYSNIIKIITDLINSFWTCFHLNSHLQDLQYPVSCLCLTTFLLFFFPSAIIPAHIIPCSWVYSPGLVLIFQNLFGNIFKSSWARPLWLFSAPDYSILDSFLFFLFIVDDCGDCVFLLCLQSYASSALQDYKCCNMLKC